MATKPKRPAKKATKRKRAQKESKKSPLTYASDLNLKCRFHVAVGGPECGKDATAYLPGCGDVCSEHRRAGATGYARKPKIDSQAAA